MSSPNYNLQPIWDELLFIYHEFRAICERHQLRYWAAYGTLLGAVRHKGFIPWDDDFDVVMPRSDYNQFIKVAPEELPGFLKWVCAENGTRSWIPFGKIYETRKEIKERVANDSNLSLRHGLFVDVFPLDGIPSTAVGRFLYFAERSLRRKLMHRSGTKVGKNKRFLRFLKRYDFDRSKCVANTDDASSNDIGHCAFREWYRSTVWLPFAGTDVPAPVDYEKILRHQYGEYMKLPPENQRLPTHQVLG